MLPSQISVVRRDLLTPQTYFVLQATTCRTPLIARKCRDIEKPRLAVEVDMIVETRQTRAAIGCFVN